MKYNILRPPVYLVNGKDARSGGEWPGKLSCKFKASKCIIRPPDNDIFLSVIKPEDSIVGSKKRFLRPLPSKEYIFRSCSKYVPPPREDYKKSKIDIFPHDEQWTYSFRPLDYSIPMLRPHFFPFIQVSKDKKLEQLKKRNAKEEFSKRILKEFRNQNNPRYNQLYQEISNNELIKGLYNPKDINTQSQKNIISNSMRKLFNVEDDGNSNDGCEDSLLYLTKLSKITLPKINNE